MQVLINVGIDFYGHYFVYSQELLLPKMNLFAFEWCMFALLQVVR